jgi:hypothetical protein
LLVRKFHAEIDPIVKREEARVLEETDFPADAEMDEDRTAKRLSRRAP